MNQLELNKKSWHSWLYQSAFSKNLPESLCPYFWGLVLSIILLPISLPSHVFNFFTERKNPRWGWNMFAGMGLTVITTFIGIFPYTPKQIYLLDIIKFFFTGILIIVLVATLATLIYFIVEYIKRLIPKKTYIYKEEKPSIIVEGIKAFFGKYCPKIDWK